MHLGYATNLSVRQAVKALAVGLLLSLVFSSIQLIVDFRRDLRDVDVRVSELLEALHDSAAEAAYSVDSGLAEDVATGLMTYPLVAEAVIRNDFGTVLAARERRPRPAVSGVAAFVSAPPRTLQVSLEHRASGSPVGVLELTVDTGPMAQQFFRRSCLVFLLDLLRLLALVAILISVYQRTLTYPLVRVIRRVSDVNAEDPLPQIIEAPRHHSRTELGSLVDTVNRLIHNFQGALVERRRSENEISLRNRLIQVFLTESDAEVYPALLRVIRETLHSPTVCIELFDPQKTHCSQADRDLGEAEERFSMSAPMLHHGRPLGEIRVQRPGPGYTDYDHRLTASIATVLAPILSARVDREREEEQRRRAEREIRASLAEKETLLREIHHRVKNNLQVISSLLSLQSDVGGDRDFLDLLAESQNRISSIALVHEELYKSTDLSRIDMADYVEKLVSRMSTIYREERGVECRTEAVRVRLSLDQAIPCGLIVNELVTNCYKHAFPGRNDGTIWVRVRRTGAMLSLDVEDDGVGMPDPVPVGASLGWLLIQNLVGQLHGSSSVERDGGTRVTVTFPQSRDGDGTASSEH